MKIRLPPKLGHKNPPQVVNLRCPVCGHMGAFHGLDSVNDLAWDVSAVGTNPIPFNAGLRICPNVDCRALVFVVTKARKLVRSYPPEVIDFDSTSLPKPILATREEAIKCHAAGCFKASALMVRRVLEELCKDKSAEGAHLKTRLAALGTTVVMPAELLIAADQLRILGNDAAHVEAKEYDDIGPDEAQLAIELAKELLKSY